jgi:hypothetical protein
MVSAAKRSEAKSNQMRSAEALRGGGRAVYNNRFIFLGPRGFFKASRTSTSFRAAHEIALSMTGGVRLGEGGELI